MKCLYNDCDRIATDQDTSGLCAFHLDLEVLADYLTENETPVTIPALVFLINLGISRGGSFVVAPDDLPELVTPDFAKKYGMELEKAA